MHFKCGGYLRVYSFSEGMSVSVRTLPPYSTMVLEASLKSSTPLGDVTSNCSLCVVCKCNNSK